MYVGSQLYKTTLSVARFFLVIVLAIGCAEAPSGMVEVENNPPTVTIVSPSGSDIQNKISKFYGVNGEIGVSDSAFEDIAKRSLKPEGNSGAQREKAEKPAVNRDDHHNTVSKSQNGGIFKKGTEIVFEGYAVDVEEDTLNKSNLEWTSNQDGKIGTGQFFIHSDLSVGDHRITLTATDSEGGTGRDTVNVTIAEELDETANKPPFVQIHSLNEGWSLLHSADIVLKGAAEDPEDGELKEDFLVWSSDIEGKLGTGSELDVSGKLSVGDHSITLIATDSEGATGSKSVNISIKEEIDDAVNESPVVNILSLTDGLNLLKNEELILEGTAEDLEDGSLAGESLVWVSSIDDTLGTGRKLDVTGELSIGNHTITLTATDTEGATGEAGVDITIEDTVNELPVAEILDVGDILNLLETELLSLEGSASDPDGEIVSMEWSSDIDGKLGTGATLEISASNLTLGDHTITFTATDDDGAIGSDSVDLTIEEKENDSPVTEILSLADGKTLLETAELILEGTAEDSEDGTLDGESLAWSSDIDGELGTGSILDVTGELSIGDHTITLTATDSEGATGSDQATLTVNLAPPTALTAEAKNSSTVQLSWEDNSNKETGFVIEQNSEVVEVLDKNVTSFEVTGLLESTSYQFRVAAEDNNGRSEFSELVTVETLPAQITTTVTADNTVDSSQPEAPINSGTLKLVNSTELKTENRVALQFSDLQDFISGRSISKATLQLTEAGLLDVSLDLEMAIKRFTDSWDSESLNWDNHLEKIGTEDLLSYNITVNAGKTTELDITSIVEAWASKEWANHGLLLKSNSDLLNVEFESLDTEGQAPQIIVDFAD